MSRALLLCLALSALTLGACGHNPDQACVDLRVAFCEKHVQCGYSDQDYVKACEKAARAQCTNSGCLDPAKPTYSPEAAEACPLSIDAMTCSQYDSLGGGELPAGPCNEICT